VNAFPSGRRQVPADGDFDQSKAIVDLWQAYCVLLVLFQIQAKLQKARCFTDEAMLRSQKGGFSYVCK
jgi:hypothetical protein